MHVVEEAEEDEDPNEGNRLRHRLRINEGPRCGGAWGIQDKNTVASWIRSESQLRFARTTHTRGKGSNLNLNLI